MSHKSSQKRIEANRLNAQNSTGPRTPEGKVRSAQNATTHGLSSLHNNPLAPGHFLKIEDETQFRLLLAEYVDTYNPQHRDEYDLVTEAVYAKWRQQRLWLAETNQIEIAIAQNEAELRKSLPAANENAHLANGVGKSEALLKLHLRYDAQLNRHYRNCLKFLLELQDRRQVQPPPPAPEVEKLTEPKPPAPATEIPTQTEPKPVLPSPEESQALARKAQIQRLMDINLGRL